MAPALPWPRGGRAARLAGMPAPPEPKGLTPAPGVPPPAAPAWTPPGAPAEPAPPGGASALTVARWRLSTSAGSKSALLPHQPRLVARPVPLGGGFALVVGLLAGGHGDLELRQALVAPVELGGDQRAALSLHRADQPVDLLALQQQLPVAARLMVEVRPGLGVGRDIGVDEHD